MLSNVFGLSVLPRCIETVTRPDFVGWCRTTCEPLCRVTIQPSQPSRTRTRNTSFAVARGSRSAIGLGACCRPPPAPNQVEQRHADGDAVRHLLLDVRL